MEENFLLLQRGEDAAQDVVQRPGLAALTLVEFGADVLGGDLPQVQADAGPCLEHGQDGAEVAPDTGVVGSPVTAAPLAAHDPHPYLDLGGDRAGQHGEFGGDRGFVSPVAAFAAKLADTPAPPGVDLA